ncbi:SpoIID/LytB domain-containing protein [Bacillus sonorensis]|uniref:SpoIID/LytB domain-containing protein n=1 Tax=Bacillus sonorensis TaxID=119858 RepID=UPI002282EF7E|nr:SpoIID/LytB domain-containing protein [Bacillus sonorensis]MCY8402976.1 SpoIID/LytB domain-containing protein [Bacillus sonorensis]
MKKTKQVMFFALIIMLLFAPSVSQAAGSISVRLSNYIGNKTSLDISTAGYYKVTGSNVAETKRFGGATRYDTANTVASSAWKNPSAVIVMNKDEDLFRDSLSVIPLAKKLDAPILLSQPNKLTSATESQIKTLDPDNILVIGGEKSISKSVESKLKKYGKIKRISGKNRYALSANIAKEMGSYNGAIVVTGSVYQDALAIAPYAAQNGYPIFLAGKDYLPDVKLPKKVILVGGTASVSKNVESKIKKQASQVTRIPGTSRYQLSANIIKYLNLNTDKAVVANGTKYADVLMGASLAAKQNRQLLLIKKDEVPAEGKSILKEKGTYAHHLIGSTNSLSSNLQTNLSKEFYLVNGKSYNLNVSSGNLSLKNIKTFGAAVKIQPEKYSTSNRISLNGKEYLGTVNFTVESGKYIRPINLDIPFEDYLKGVVPNEMPARWPLEALKAQAVAARTYSVSKIGQTVADTTAFQVYGGYSWSANSSKAVDQTKGKVLKYNGSLITAVYSSSNGGYTEASNEVWSSKVPYLIAKKDSMDPQNSWSLKLSKTQIHTGSLNLNSAGSWWSKTTETNESQLKGLKNWITKNKETGADGVKIAGISSIAFSGKTQGQRPKRATIKVNYLVKNNSKVTSKSATIDVLTTDLRTMIGASVFKSTYVKVKEESNRFVIAGKGYGHGIGMSQYGAKERAAAGNSYSSILKFYYPGTTLTNY